MIAIGMGDEAEDSMATQEQDEEPQEQEQEQEQEELEQEEALPQNMNRVGADQEDEPR